MAMKNIPYSRNRKLLAFAARTATATAFLATTVAVETATAAIFTSDKYIDDIGTVTIDYGDDGTTALGGASEWTSVKVADDDSFGWDGTFQMWWNDSREMVVNEGYDVDNPEEMFIRVEVFGGGSWSYDLDDFVTGDTSENDFIHGQEGDDILGGGNEDSAVTVPEPSGAIALGVLGLGLVASRLRRRS